MAGLNGNKALLMTMIGWAVLLGVQVGTFWALRGDVARLRNHVETQVPTRAEMEQTIKLRILEYGIQSKAVDSQRLAEPRPRH